MWKEISLQKSFQIVDVAGIGKTKENLPPKEYNGSQEVAFHYGWMLEGNMPW